MGKGIRKKNQLSSKIQKMLNLENEGDALGMRSDFLRSWWQVFTGTGYSTREFGA